MKINKIFNESLNFDNGLEIYSSHDQDCCEHHYAAFSALTAYNLNTVTGETVNILDVEFDENIEDHIQLVKDMGFNLIAKDGSRYFVPCYAENNGYYNSSLDLVIEFNGKEVKTINISHCQEWTDC